MKINQIIREKRKALSLTQEQVADFLGVSAAAVNKWEKGSTYPDITLLPALARLLKTDLNTLLSFRDDLTAAEIEAFVDGLDRTVQQEGYPAAFARALDKIHEYPACDALAYSAILYLDGARNLFCVAEPEQYQATFEAFYQRLSASEDPEIRETALGMLISGAMERGHDMVYVCYDNEAYMNTGIQRSSSTPHFADTTTTPQGKVIPGKMQQKKNLTKIMVAHGIPYVAQTTFIGNFKDITEKAHKAIYTPGAAFLNVMAPCPRGWRYPSEKLMEVTKMAVETCVWPLYEVVEGKYILSYKPKNKLPVEEYLKMQGRFSHMFKPGNEWMIEEVQKEVDRNWEELLKLCEL